MMATTTLPEYHEWTGSPMWRAHLLEERHDEAACAGCQVRKLGYMAVIHEAVFGPNPKFASICWALQDGYGEIGGYDDQDFDWSGIRDSSPAAIARMYVAVTA